VVNDAAFQNWWEHDDPHLLWIHGDPGKGKTMMMFSLYSEVLSRIAATGLGAVVSYFFCQSLDLRLNHAVAVLRGLIFLLVA
jgi:predicted ATPase